MKKTPAEPIAKWVRLGYNGHIDVLVKTPDEIAEQLRRGNFFLRQILTEGRVLYERDA